ncbi:MAG: DNA-3-methyladenine glycosylase I [Flavobacteriaceae bacterium]|jgi:DNA-3-methyladenine glycosylase I|nr:DNA-3-methyladenine glycosylase I [Flavobacteriaceae bacterium]
MANTYCDFCNSLAIDSIDPNKHYHDNEYGFELFDDNEIFGRLILEINQAGLSWTTILKKKENFYEAFDAYSITTIANYDENKYNQLLNNAGIIRNKLKINAVIYNANQVLLLQKDFGSFKIWLDLHRGFTLEEWVKLFKKHFKFVGGEIVNEFLMSMGYLEGAHKESCEVYYKIKEQKLKEK